MAPRTVSAAMAGRAERDDRARVEPRARVVLGDRERVVCLQAAGAERVGAAAGAAVAVASKHGCAGALPRRARPDGVLPLLPAAGGIPARPLSRAARAAAAFARRRIWSPAPVAEIHQHHGSTPSDSLRPATRGELEPQFRVRVAAARSCPCREGPSSAAVLRSSIHESSSARSTRSDPGLTRTLGITPLEISL